MLPDLQKQIVRIQPDDSFDDDAYGQERPQVEPTGIAARGKKGGSGSERVNTNAPQSISNPRGAGSIPVGATLLPSREAH